MKRLPIPKRLRFEIFKRDNFRCQYCGRSAPEFPICIDHVQAVANNGTEDQWNLVTSCVECNTGKSDVPLEESVVEELLARMRKNGTLRVHSRPKKSPTFPIEIKDWLSDQNVVVCSPSAKSLYIELLCIMHRGKPKGFLTWPNGSEHCRERVCCASGFIHGNGLEFLDELLRKGVLSETRKGIIYSPRMVRDGKISKMRSRAGKVGGKHSQQNKNEEIAI